MLNRLPASCVAWSKTIALAASLVALCACAPEPGSEAWCDNMSEKPKGDWTMSEAGEYAKSCIIRTEEG